MIIGTVIGVGLAIPYSKGVLEGIQCGVPSNNKPAMCDSSSAASALTKAADRVSNSGNNSAIPRLKTGPNKWPVGTLKYYMVKTGFKGQKLNDMAAILVGESGIGKGKINAMAHNCNTKTLDDSYGLGQINLLGDLIVRLNTYNLKNAEALYEPVRNLQITYELAQSSTGYKHWGSFNQKTYLRFYGLNPVVVRVRNTHCPN